MLERACLDAGPIYLYYRNNPPEKIKILINKIKKQKIIAFVPAVILIEVYKHICVTEGRNHAISCLISFQHNINAKYISLTPDLILEAGKLKCQYRTKLSYNDCITIATSLMNNAKLHTTEKSLPKIQRLQIITYSF